MATKIYLPELAESMTSATLTTWLKRSGDHVAMGEPIAELETDKTTVELPAPADGILDDIQVLEGTEGVAVGSVLAMVRDASDPVIERERTPSVQTEVRLPELAESMISATLTTWFKRPGDSIVAGEPIAEIETDKTTVELPAPADGVIDVIHVAAGTEDVAVNTVLATLRSTDNSRKNPDVVDAPIRIAVELSAKGVAAPLSTPRQVEPVTPQGSVVAALSSDVSATPLARSMAALAGIDLVSLSASIGGRQVTKADVEQQLNAPLTTKTEAAVASPRARATVTTASLLDGDHTDEPLTAMRRVTAERMVVAKQTVPHFYLEVSCSVDRLLALRELKNAASGTYNVTVNDVVVRAVALALTAVPQANSAWTGDAVRVFEAVNVAVAVTTPAGLVTPVVRGADTKDLQTIAAELRELTTRARDGRLQPSDYTGGTCTISNLGMFGVSSLYAILNPPQSCILGIGAIESRPVVRDEAVGVGSVMTVTLSADHRAIDGVIGAEFLLAFKQFVEDPNKVFG